MYARTFRSELPSICARSAHNLRGRTAMRAAFSATLRLGTAAACCLPPACLQPSPALPRWVLGFAAAGLLLGDGLQHPPWHRLHFFLLFFTVSELLFTFYSLPVPFCAH